MDILWALGQRMQLGVQRLVVRIAGVCFELHVERVAHAKIFNKLVEAVRAQSTVDVELQGDSSSFAVRATWAAPSPPTHQLVSSCWTM